MNAWFGGGLTNAILTFVKACLLHQVGNERQHAQVTGALDGSSDTTLIFQAITCNPAGQQFALLIDELEEKIRIFVIDVFDAKFAETAVFFATQPDFRVAEKFYIFSGSSHNEW